MLNVSKNSAVRPEVVLPGKRICLIDDDEDQLVILRRLLMKSRAKIESFRSPLMALDKIRENPPDIIVLDIMMPDCDGWAFYEELRQQESLAEVPVLFVSCLLNARNAPFMRDEHLCDSLPKPVRKDELFTKLVGLLEN
ncbi:MAG: response regulator [Opitutales bacterium]|nr:response regulator [Opitutales bacterium]MCH8541479.1 response regulator [Opitutales bacterium]